MGQEGNPGSAGTGLVEDLKVTCMHYCPRLHYTSSQSLPSTLRHLYIYIPMPATVEGGLFAGFVVLRRMKKCATGKTDRKAAIDTMTSV
jgi:hypothetical protein